MTDFDVVIAGGGPAGLAAALMLGRVRRRTLVCDTGQGRNATVVEAHGYFTRDPIAPQELRRVGREQLARYPSVEIRDTAVDDIAVTNEGLVATLAGGQRVSARRVILATGLADDLPAVDGLVEIWGKSAFHCPYCDGWETQGKTVAILADGDSAVRLALQLVRFTPEIVVCTNGGEELDGAGENLLAGHNIGVRREPVARFDRDGHQVRSVTFASGPPQTCDEVFAAATYRQRSDLPSRLGCDLFDDGTLQVNDFGQTSVPAVYAVGDMARTAAFPGPLAQIMFAAASGQLAGAVIDQELLVTDIPDYPSPLRRNNSA